MCTVTGFEQQLAVKKMKGRFIDFKISAQKEISMLRNLRHDNIVKFLGSVVTDDKAAIIMEYVEREDLFTLLKKERAELQWNARGKTIALGIALGLAALHSEGIVHRDLKSSNILITKSWTPKIADVGFSRQIDKARYGLVSTVTGTRSAWTAPEVFRNNSYSFQTDIFSLGVVLWELYFQERPWETVNDMALMLKVAVNGERLELLNMKSDSLKQLIGSCWYDQPSWRPASWQVVLKLQELVSEES